MTKLSFNSNDRPTLGVELELALVDDQSMELTSAIEDVLAALGDKAGSAFKPELMQCVIEINTGICNTVADAEQDLRGKLQMMEGITDQLGLRLWWGGTHPFSLWREQEVTRNDRYENLVKLLQEMARRLVTFGLHVHVGVDSGDKAVMILRPDHATSTDAAGPDVQQPLLGESLNRAAIASLQSHGRTPHGRSTDTDAKLERICLARQPHGRHGLYQYDSGNLVGRPAAP